jgi:negative regulator of sigma-B (phosphoserine phosphatase)
MKLAIAHRSAPKEGETDSGDIVVRRELDGRTLIAVIDALGHGPRAAQTAAAAAEALSTDPFEGAAIPVVQRLHKHLRGTRGAAALVVIIDGARLDACGVGNVEMRSQGLTVPVVLTPGILGSNVRTLRGFGAKLATRRGRIVIFTDGIASRFDLDEHRAATAEEACIAIFERYRRSHDDASVVVADFEE